MCHCDLWAEVVRASHVLHVMGQGLKVPVSSYLALLGQGSLDNPQGASDLPMTLVPLIEKGKVVGTRLAQERFSPTDGTSVSGYAYSALKLAEASTASHRLAVFMTDGECFTTHYLSSIHEMAKARGVHLVGVVMGGDAQRIAKQHPNALICKDATDFALKVGRHLANVIEGKV